MTLNEKLSAIHDMAKRKSFQHYLPACNDTRLIERLQAVRTAFSEIRI